MTSYRRCAICGSTRRIEAHHVAGRANLPDTTVDLCRGCHRKIGDQMADLGVDLTGTGADPAQLVWAFLCGFGLLLASLPHAAADLGEPLVLARRRIGSVLCRLAVGGTPFGPDPIANARRAAVRARWRGDGRPSRCRSDHRGATSDTDTDAQLRTLTTTVLPTLGDAIQMLLRGSRFRGYLDLVGRITSDPETLAEALGRVERDPRAVLLAEQVRRDRKTLIEAFAFGSPIPFEVRIRTVAAVERRHLKFMSALVRSPDPDGVSRSLDGFLGVTGP